MLWKLGVGRCHLRFRRCMSKNKKLNQSQRRSKSKSRLLRRKRPVQNRPRPKKETTPERPPPADKAEKERFIELINSTRQEDLASLRGEIEAGFQSGALAGGITFVVSKLVAKDLAEGAKLAATVQNSL